MYEILQDVKTEQEIVVEPLSEDVVSLDVSNKLDAAPSRPDGSALKTKAKREDGNKKRKKSTTSLFQCEQCPKVYPTLGGIYYHKHTCHNESFTPVACDLCGQVFRVRKNMENHKNVVHLKRRDHLCDICGKGLSSKFGLRLHKAVHAGEKKFSCEICGRKFSTQGKVNAHKKVHGGPKQYVCEVCSRAFRWKKSLVGHMRTHSGEKPHQCEHCDRSFSALWNMQQHVRIHTGDRPYACPSCPRTFTLNYSLKEHQAKSHRQPQPIEPQHGSEN